MSGLRPSGIGSGRAYEAARLRWAGEADADRLTVLWRQAHAPESGPPGPEERGTMREWLEHGGALLLEDAEGCTLCALRWRWADDGWRVDRIATLPAARGQGFGRWLMTKVEALAIKRNIPTLTLTLHHEELLAYYRRMGYQESAREGDAVTLVKRVGGTWQRQPGSDA